MLTLKNVTKNFGTTQVLHALNLSVTKNTILGLAGGSGSGKSTLLRCIQKLETIDRGEILYNAEIGFMFQDFQLFPHLTILENLTYAPALKNKNSNHTAKAMQLLKNLGIADKASFYPSRISGGQKQRAALARTLMLHPQILLCDEPTSGLDVATTLDVVTLLTSIQKMGVTMIIASHDLDFLTRIANRILVLKNGSFVLDVEPQQLADPVDYIKNYY